MSVKSSSTSSSSSSLSSSSSSSSMSVSLPSVLGSVNVNASMIDGAQIVAECLRVHGVKRVFGVVGIPIIEVSYALQSAGISFYSFRNEQSSSYAANAAGALLLSQEKECSVGVCLSVSGPGLVHSLAGISNAAANGWPMLLISGSYASDNEHMGSFQELDQLSLVRPLVKFGARVPSLISIPRLLCRALYLARAGRPGPCYLELPADLVTATVPRKLFQQQCEKWLTPILVAAASSSSTSSPSKLISPVRFQADPESIQSAVSLLRSAARPLVIIGKGAAYSAEGDARLGEFVTAMNLPFLSMPMAKGVVSDNHPLCVSAARTHALKEADVILLVGARLNWQLHFGPTSGRFNDNVKFIQIDINVDEFHRNTIVDVCLCGDIALVVRQLLQAWTQHSSSSSSQTSSSQQEQWRQTLRTHSEKNSKQINSLIQTSVSSIPLAYYPVFDVIRSYITPTCLVVSEGANTMDIGRSMIGHECSLHRLDAGTHGTMGVGTGFAIAAATIASSLSSSTTTSSLKISKVLSISGDSAFGFSATDVETAVRYRLPILFIIFNNSGIYEGIKAFPTNPSALNLPSTALSPDTAYHKLCESVGGKGVQVTTLNQLHEAMKIGMAENQVPFLINVILEREGKRKQQKHDWLTKTPPSKL